MHYTEQTDIPLSNLLLNSELDREIYLIFHDDTEYFFSRFIQKGFKHVFALERQALGWVCFDPSRTDIYPMILPASYSIDVIAEYKRQNPDHPILKLNVTQLNQSNYPRPAIQSCVGAIQYLLGVYWPFVFTPKQLYNKLIKNNTKHIEAVNYVG